MLVMHRRGNSGLSRPKSSVSVLCTALFEQGVLRSTLPGAFTMHLIASPAGHPQGRYQNASRCGWTTWRREPVSLPPVQCPLGIARLSPRPRRGLVLSPARVNVSLSRLFSQIGAGIDSFAPSAKRYSPATMLPCPAKKQQVHVQDYETLSGKTPEYRRENCRTTTGFRPQRSQTYPTSPKRSACCVRNITHLRESLDGTV